MPDIEHHAHHQLALLWEATGYDDYGNPTRSAASQELHVRWETRRTFALDSQGNKIAIDATVFTDQEIPLGSVMWEGGLADLAAELPGTGTGTDLEPTADLFEVVTSATTKDIRGRAVRRQVGLKRLGEAMPEEG